MKIFKFIENIKRKLFVIAYKKLDINLMTEAILYLRKEDVSYFPFSYNTIKIINIGGDVFFFRECFQHGDLKSRIDLSCKEFFEMLRGEINLFNFSQKIPLRIKYTEEEIMRFEKVIELWKKDKAFYDELRNIEYYIKISGFGIWKGCKTLSQKSKDRLAIPYLNKDQEELFSYFVVFVSSYIESWLFHWFVNENDYETYYASRSLGTYKVASVLGVASLVPECKFVKLIIEGESPKYGVLCKKALGVRGLDSKAPATPALQRELTKLTMLDALTYETDHFANNYNVISSNTGLNGVCAFDNDSKWTFFPFLNTPRQTARKGVGLLFGKGKMSLTYLDKELADVIMNVDKKNMIRVLSPYLNSLQMVAFMHRLRMLRNVFKKNKEKLLGPEHFNSETLNRELSSGVCSYLYQFVHKEELNSDYLGKD